MIRRHLLPKTRFEDAAVRRIETHDLKDWEHDLAWMTMCYFWMTMCYFG